MQSVAKHDVLFRFLFQTNEQLPPLPGLERIGSRFKMSKFEIRREIRPVFLAAPAEWRLLHRSKISVKKQTRERAAGPQQVGALAGMGQPQGRIEGAEKRLLYN